LTAGQSIHLPIQECFHHRRLIGCAGNSTLRIGRTGRAGQLEQVRHQSSSSSDYEPSTKALKYAEQRRRVRSMPVAI